MARNIAWKRTGAMAAAVAAAALLILAFSLKPWRSTALGPPPVNPGTAKMQAEIMALAIRSPVLPPPPASLPQPMAMDGRGTRTAPQNGSGTQVAAAAVNRWRPEEQPLLSDPVDSQILVIDHTLPYCWPGGPLRFCQDDHDLVEWVDDRPMYDLRRQLQAQLPLVNRRSARVPDAALQGAAHLSFVQLRTLQTQGDPHCMTDDSLDGKTIILLSKPVFSADNQWAMIAVAGDYCSSIGGQRSRMLFHREQGRWVLERPERALSGIRQGQALWPRRH